MVGRGQLSANRPRADPGSLTGADGTNNRRSQERDSAGSRSGFQSSGAGHASAPVTANGSTPRQIATIEILQGIQNVSNHVIHVVPLLDL